MGNKSSFNINTREPSPCDGCTERFIACSGRCPKDERGEYGYNAWIAKLELIKQNRKAYDDLNRRKSWQR